MAREKNQMKLVFVSNNVMEAEETRCFLAGTGIDAVVFDSRLVTLNPFLGGPVGGVKVAVPADQYERARAAMHAAGRSGDTGESFHP